MSAARPKDERLTVNAFLEWAIAQPQGRFELVDGHVVAMAPERARHNLIKAEAYVALRDAISQSGVSSTAYADGMIVLDPPDLTLALAAILPEEA